MIKLVAIFSLKPNIDPEKAYMIWREKHTAWAKDKTLPEAKRYTINRTIHKYPPAGGTVAEFDIFGYEMFWFDNLESALKTTERLRNAQPDEFLAEFTTNPKMVIIEEENIVL